MEVDDELELGGLNHRQIGRFDALENLTGHNADLTKHIENIGSIAHEPARFDHLTRKIIRWHSKVGRERDKLHPPAEKESIGTDEYGIGRFSGESCEGCLDFLAGAGFEQLNLQA